MNRTSIEWCRTYAADGSFTEGYSVNPIRFMPAYANRSTTMCQKVSPECKNCYAQAITRRWWPKDLDFPGYTALGIVSGEFFLDEKTLMSVLKCKNPGKVFWCDMTDIFGDWVKEEWLDLMFAVMMLTPHLTHILLTKRPERRLSYLRDSQALYARVLHAVEGLRHKFPRMAGSPIGDPPRFPLQNVWHGVSVGGRKTAERLQYQRITPAAVRFCSYEPALELVDFTRIDLGVDCYLNALTGEWSSYHAIGGLMKKPGAKLDWIIVGGESGAGARPFNIDWARQTIQQCKATRTPVFVKQMGSKPFLHASTSFHHEEPGIKISVASMEVDTTFKFADAKGGDINEWPDDLRIRQFPEVA